MSEYKYKIQTAEDIKLSDENEKAAQEFLKQLENDIRQNIKELKDAGYTDEQIKQAYNYAASKIFYGL